MRKMSAARTIRIFRLALAAGCAALLAAPPGAIAQAQACDIVTTDKAAEAVSAPAATGAQPCKAETPTPAAEKPVPAPAAAAEQPRKTQTPTPAAKKPAKAGAPVAAVEQPRKTEAAPPAAKKAEPPLDVDTLKARLRDTKAIGFFTKLELQNQMNDLLQQFRERYQNGQTAKVVELRQPFNMLVLKVLALVQDGDPPLARMISESRDAIWSMLADPEKFKTIS